MAPPQTPLGKLTGYSAPPDPLAGFKGPTSKGRGRKGGKGGKEWMRKKMIVKEGKMEGRGGKGGTGMGGKV